MPFPPGYKGPAAGVGRPKGLVNKATSEARDFARSIVCDPQYRAKLLEHAQLGVLSDNLHKLLWAYAFGQPPKTVKVEVTGKVDELRDKSNVDLASRAADIAREFMEQEAAAREARARDFEQTPPTGSVS